MKCKKNCNPPDFIGLLRTAIRYTQSLNFVFRVAWKVRCKDDPDLARYTRDCKDDESGKSFFKLFQPGVMEPSKRKVDVKKHSDMVN